VALREDHAARYVEAIRASGHDLGAAVVGRVIAKDAEGRIEVTA
jgi:hypothetical protein